MSARKINKGAQGGKQKFWRAMAVKGYGRKLRNAMGGANHEASPTLPIIEMLKRAGIETPSFDKVMADLYTKKQSDVSHVEDVEFTEGVPA
jgi:hypothetical protein